MVIRRFLRLRRHLANMLALGRAAWADGMAENASELRDTAEAEHSAWIPLLMATCDHALLIRHPYRPATTPDGKPTPRDYCPRCAGLTAVPGFAGARLALICSLAELYDALGGVRLRVHPKRTSETEGRAREARNFAHELRELERQDREAS